jgi:hypothetical protein
MLVNVGMLPPVTRLTVALALAAAALAQAGAASITVAQDASRPALRVDARGNAEVSWTAAGRRRFLFIPARGRVLPGRRLSSRDVSRPYSGIKLPFQKVLRRTRNGRLWALQAWRLGSGGVELRFSRWTGDPMEVHLSLSPLGNRLAGHATFHGRPVTGFTRSPTGRRLRVFAYLDCFGCPAAQPGQWGRMLGVTPREDGTFTVSLRPEWTGARYRVTVMGPNPGLTYAPDGGAEATTVGNPPYRRASLVSYARTGGFAGLRESLTVFRGGAVTSTNGSFRLSARRLAALEAALRSARFSTLARRYPADYPVSDGFVYRVEYASRAVTVEDGGRPPARLRRVLALLTDILGRRG